MEDKLITKKEEKIYNVQSIYNTYFDNLNSVQIYFNKFGTLATGEDDSIKEKSQEFYDSVLADLHTETEKRATISEEQKDGKLTKIEAREFLSKIAKKFKNIPKISPKNYEILSRSSFLMLNNYFEYLIADLLTYYYNKFKNSLNDKEFKITLKELNEYETIEEATKNLILKEVESIIIEKTFDQLLLHFEDKLSISLENELIKWDKIIELRERRHLIVHNSSIINKKYISRTKNPFNFNIGDTVHIDNEYFINAWKEFKIAGQLLIFNCWGNWDKDNIDNAIYEIMIQTYEDLKSKQYDIVCKTCKYSEQIIPTNDDQEDYLLRIKVNNAISLKKQNKKTELNKVLKSMKVGTATPIFKICYKILKDDHSDLVDYFRKSILLEELNVDYYTEWPIFDFVRKKEDLNSELLKTFET